MHKALRAVVVAPVVFTVVVAAATPGHAVDTNPGSVPTVNYMSGGNPVPVINPLGLVPSIDPGSIGPVSIIGSGHVACNDFGTPFTRSKSGLVHADSPQAFNHAVVPAVVHRVSVSSTSDPGVTLTVRDSHCRKLCIRTPGTYCDVTFPLNSTMATLVVESGGYSEFAIEMVPLVPGLRTTCSDGVDNDADGHADYPSDGSCDGTYGGSEGECSVGAVASVCASVVPTGPGETYALLAPGVTTSPLATGGIYRYRLTLPNGAVITTLCAVVNTSDPCAAVGERTIDPAVVLLENVLAPEAGEPEPYLTITLCGADLTLTVDGLGLSSFPAYTAC